MIMMFLAMLEDEDDQRRFLKLHDAYETKMFQVARKILSSQSQAEDAVQQSWLQIIQHFETVKSLPWEKTAGYVVITVKNVSLSMLRQERHEAPFPEQWDAPAPQQAGVDTFGYLLELIGAMPEKYRRVLELKFVLEYSNREIAKLLGLKESTVSTHAARGRQLLKSKLEQEGYCYVG
jgi:RNA polymerase sigma-70 factor (ECF subfamily)